MNVRIIKTKEVKELGIIDAASGQDYIADFIGNTGAMNDGQFVWFEEDDMYETTLENFEWWERVSGAYEKADQVQYDFVNALEDEDEKEKFLSAVQDACNCDLEDMGGAIMSVVNEWIDK